MREPCLRTLHVSVTVRGRALISDVTLEVTPGTITAVLGPNGAGKSTLIKTIVGLVPYQGEILIHGTPASELSLTERARQVSYVPQQSLLNDAVPVRSVVAQGRYAHGYGIGRLRTADTVVIDEAMHDTDTTHLAASGYSELSYGERRRVLIARALATGASIILLDEPTASLDLAHSLSLYALLQRLATAGRCILVALHDLDGAKHVARECLVLSQGEVVIHGKTDSVLASMSLQRVFGVELIPGGGLGYRLLATSNP